MKQRFRPPVRPGGGTATNSRQELRGRNTSRRYFLAGGFAGCAWWSLPKGVAAENRTRFVITVIDGQVAPEQQTLRIAEGNSVEIEFTSDRGMDLHLHGIDVELMLVPGKPTVMRFNAAHPGRFPVEAHGSGGHTSLIYVEVHPR